MATAFTVAVAAGLPASATGSSCTIDPFDCAAGRGLAAGAHPGGDGTQLGVARKVRVTPGNAGRRSRAKGRHKRNGWRCTKLGRTTTCTRYRHGRATRVCVRRGHRRFHCRRVRHRAHRSAGPFASAASTTNQGFLSTNIRQVGKIWLNGHGHCTGTVVARNVIITAGHCLYVNGEAQREEQQNGVTPQPQGYFAGRGEVLEFTPNSYWNGGNPIIETTGFDNQTAYAGDGVWRIINTWVPQCFADSNMQCDVGFAQIEAHNSSYVGDVVGSWPVRTEMYIPVGAHYFDVGYPEDGVFSDARNGYGNAQYFCDISWQGDDYLYDAYATSGVANLASDNPDRTRGTYNGCQHTGGASGGPAFIGLTDGSWVINGVNSVGQSNGSWGWSISWNWFGSVATGLYCYVLGCGQTASQSANALAPARAAPAWVSPQAAPVSGGLSPRGR